jgi:hypothetical protein
MHGSPSQKQIESEVYLNKKYAAQRIAESPPLLDIYI